MIIAGDALVPRMALWFLACVEALHCHPRA
jgi:hypothetical protein